MSHDSPSRAVQRCRFIPEEDALLRQLVTSFGPNNWERIAQYFPDRNVRQCRDRWNHYLTPNTVPVPSQPNHIAQGGRRRSAPHVNRRERLLAPSVHGSPWETVECPVADHGVAPEHRPQSEEELCFRELFSSRLELERDMTWPD
jgi:hypothetical protein